MSLAPGPSGPNFMNRAQAAYQMLKEKRTKEYYGVFVSSDGEVFNRDGTPRRMNLCGGRSGSGRYKSVCVGSMNRYIHRIVAELFIGPCPPGMEVNHRDGDKQNNRVENLEYVTRNQNVAHAKSIGHFRNGERLHNSKLNASTVLEIRRLRREQNLAYNKIARMFGVTTVTVFRADKGHCWGHVA